MDHEGEILIREETEPAREDPVLAAWGRFRRVLHSHARAIIPAAALIWIALVVATIVLEDHATFAIATVGFGLSAVISLATSDPTTSQATAIAPGKRRRVPDTAFLPELARRRKARTRPSARDETTAAEAADEP